MIWGGGGNFQNEFIFSREPLPYFSPEKGLRIFFFLDFLRPHPPIINGRPLTLRRKYKLRTTKIWGQFDPKDGLNTDQSSLA